MATVPQAPAFPPRPAPHPQGRLDPGAAGPLRRAAREDRLRAQGRTGDRPDRESAYRLRRHPGAGSFRAAWDTAISGKQQPRWKFTQAEARDLAIDGPFHIALHRTQPRTICRKPDDSRLLSFVTRLDRLLAYLTPSQEDELLAWAVTQPHLRRFV